MFDVKKITRKDTAPYTFRGLAEQDIVIDTRPLSLDTREVFNDAFRDRPADKTATKPDAKPEPATPYDQRMANRASNLETLARCCVASWQGVTKDGSPVECTPETALAFLKFLDENGYREEVTLYIQWASNPLSFREPVVEAEELGKR